MMSHDHDGTHEDTAQRSGYESRVKGSIGTGDDTASVLPGRRDSGGGAGWVGTRPEAGRPGRYGETRAIRRDAGNTATLRGEAALARSARALPGPPVARKHGEHRSRGAKRSGGFRGVVPPGVNAPPRPS